MSFTNGVFTLAAGNPVVTGTTISSTTHNNTESDIATGLSTCVLKDGTQTITADIPMATYKFTGLGAGGAAGNSLRYEQLFTTSAVALLGAMNWVKGADVASATTTNLTTATGNAVHVTGTTTITAVTLGSGMWRLVIFDGALTLTHHTTNNNLPGAANITTAANDRALYWSDGTTVYCVAYQKANGQPTVNVSLTANVTGILPTANGGTGIAYFTAAGPTQARVYTFPDSAATILYAGGALGTPASGTGTNLTGIPVGGLTMNTARLLGRTTASAGVAEEITVGAGLSLAATALTATGAGNHCVEVHTGNGYGSTNTKIRRYTTAMTNVGTDITYADSAANGASFTINTTAFYELYRSDVYSAAVTYIGASVNSAQLTTDLTSITVATRLMIGDVVAARTGFVSRVVYLTATDVVRPHDMGLCDGANDLVFFGIRKVSIA